jgi:hypothetical protein
LPAGAQPCGREPARTLTMPTPQSAQPSESSILSRPSVFLNLPYDRRFKSLYLAYIAGVCAFGMTPRTTLEIPGSQRRLDRIFNLIRDCPYSIHDLSRVQLDRKRPATPRFNMPFELGLAVAHEKLDGKHAWFVFEEVDERLEKSLSDLKGTDVYIHHGKTNSVFAKLGNAFLRHRPRPTVPQMTAIYLGLYNSVPRIMEETGADTLFEARPFQELAALASGLTDRVVVRRRR